MASFNDRPFVRHPCQSRPLSRIHCTDRKEYDIYQPQPDSEGTHCSGHQRRSVVPAYHCCQEPVSSRSDLRLSVWFASASLVNSSSRGRRCLLLLLSSLAACIIRHVRSPRHHRVVLKRHYAPAMHPTNTSTLIPSSPTSQNVTHVRLGIKDRKQSSKHIIAVS